MSIPNASKYVIPNDSYFCKNDNLLTYIFIFEFKSWALVVFHEIFLETSQRIVTWKNNF